MSTPKFGELWTAEFPFEEPDVDGAKLRTVFILGYNRTDETVAAVKVTSVDPRTCYSGQFGLYKTDTSFAKTGLHKDCKVDFQRMELLPLSAMKKRIGHLDVDGNQVAQRLMAAIKVSKYADEIARLARTIG